jgi:putative transposase
MANPIQPIILSEQEQRELQAIVNQGSHSARKIKRAQILLHSHAGKRPPVVAEWLDVCLSTVYNTRRRYLDEGLAAALSEKARSGQPPKLDLRQQAEITRLACSQAPAGHARWTVRLLADHVVQAEIVDHIAPETIRQFLKETD